MFKNMKKGVIASVLSVSLLVPVTALAANSYTVVKGDSLWKIAVKTQTGVQELIDANPQLSNPNVIYPGQEIKVPEQEGQAIEQEVIRLVNVERANAGLPALKYDWELARVAEHKSQDMADKNYFSHTSPTYGSPFNMMKNYGINYRSAGENIAQGQKTAAQVVDAWMNSEGHRANILNKNYTHIGVGYVANGNYWTQMFIQK
ncbi:SafA/ExsA family spore coat assembly protein [Ureibacillus composti]|uniref:SafA/ExsA family spore coat assembly protein n=1 Tax=Lysinibacillus composti TaxID=720633 RepID=A0A3N9UBV9_9BACI|nr:SafA/ExsA family spore coat assembly protein [Lysinibacillus composti]MBM7609434.1 putative YkwD family protein/spore coat assembly protein SafA [Lysinibacillus composti]MDM5335595.1 SafA/ExsA family spore coat assembly protein [Ureibacillus composti]RQW73969.1 SafA/ExsA family spore coat assembly protein [Lysinibacillus composti]